MSYIQKTLSNDETVLIFLRKHWFYFVPYALISLWLLPVSFKLIPNPILIKKEIENHISR